MVIRSVKGDTPTTDTLWQGTTDTLWQGASGNKMLDEHTFNTERFSVLYTQYVKMRAPNLSVDV